MYPYFNPKTPPLLRGESLRPHLPCLSLLVNAGPVALANTIRWRLEEKVRLEKEEEEARRRAAEEERRRKERERTRTPGPFSPEVMVQEGPVILEDSWCRCACVERDDD